MQADQVPSDAEIASIVSTVTEFMVNGGADEGDIDRMSNAFAALLRERQAVPARIAAAVMAERDACAKLCDALDQFGRGTTGKTALAWSAAAGSLAGQIHGRPVPEGTAPLAAQLAVAEARGMRLAADVCRDEVREREEDIQATTLVNYREYLRGQSSEAERCMNRILALIPTPPAGGADDAG